MIPNDALDDRLAFVGIAGSGKTYGAGVAVERLLARRSRVVIVDPLGVWWGLRLLADGKTASNFNVVIFGGGHADLPINEHAGALIGETVAASAESCVIDLSLFGTKAAERRFMLAFLEAIYRKASGEPFNLVFDEADLWAPQKSSEPQLQAKMEQIVRRGRVKGFIPWLITQRPAVLSKDVLSQADGMIAFKLTGSHDRDAIKAWIEGQADKTREKEILAKLATMQRGQAVVWLPARGVLETMQFPAKVTFDSSRSPKRGERISRVDLKPIDLGKLRERLATVEAETRANDPAALKKRIAELTSENRKLINSPKPAVADPEAERRAYEKGAAEGLRAGAAAGWAAAIAYTKRHIAEFPEVPTAVNNARLVEEHVLRAPIPPFQPSGQATPPPSGEGPPRQAVSPRPAKPSAAPGVDGNYSGRERRVLTALAFWHSIGHDTPSREQVAAIAGYSPSSGTFRNIIGGLRTAGAIDYPPEGGAIFLTGAAGGSLTLEAARDMLLANLEPRQRKIIDSLCETAVSRSRGELGGRTGYEPTSGTFRNILGSLRTLKIIDYPRDGEVGLTDWARELLG